MHTMFTGMWLFPYVLFKKETVSHGFGYIKNINGVFLLVGNVLSVIQEILSCNSNHEQHFAFELV